MKTHFFSTLAIVAFVGLFASCSSSGKSGKTDWDEYELKGRVKQLTIELYDPNSTLSRNGEPVLRSAKTIHFNPEGQTEFVELFGLYMQRAGYCSYTYTKKDNKLYKRKDYHNWYSVQEFIYDDNRIVQENGYTGEKLDVIEKYEYDEKGNLVKVMCYRPDGRLSSFNEYTYDEHGRVTREVVRSSSGSIQLDRSITYTDKGFVQFEGEGPYRTEYMHEQFDNVGNYTLRNINDKGRGIIMEKRTIIYY